MDKRIIFYLIDEDEQHTEILHKLISKVYPNMYVKRFNDGFSAWKSFGKEKLEVIMICEYDIQGINGIQILKKLRSDERLKDTYFIMVSGSHDREVLVKSVQAGADDFLPKPLSLDLFLLKLKTTSRIQSFSTTITKLSAELEELKKEVEPQTGKLVEIYSNIQKMRLPEKEKEIERIISASKFISKQLTNDADELNEIELAASICYTAKSMFKDKFVELPVMVNGIIQNPAMNSYHDYVNNLFKDVKGFENTYNILISIYENFDGSGVPAKIKAWAIPLGARILRAVTDFELHYSKNPKNADKIIPLLWTEINKIYDFRVLTFYDQYLGYLNTLNSPVRRATEIVVNPFALEKGMILSRNIITISGLKLLSLGTKLVEDNIKKIQEAKNADAYIGHIFVKIESIPPPVIK